jgi:putative NADPH-quinone reductase
MAQPQRIFSPAQAARAVKALQKAGVSVARVKFTADGFEIVAGEPEAQDGDNWFAGSPLYRDVA